MRILLVALAVCVSVSVASARPPLVPDDDYVEPPKVDPVPVPIATAAPWQPSWRFEGGFGARFGTQLVDNASTGTMKAAHFDAGVRDGRLLLTAEYQVGSLTLPGSAFAARGGNLRSGTGRGLEHRLGAVARYNFARLAESDGGLAFWAEGGLGVEHYRWDAGGTWTRPDVSLGIGAAVWGQSERKHGGLSIGVRIALAPRDDVAHAAVACGGPCDAATTPTGWDRSVLFDMTAMFGK